MGTTGDERAGTAERSRAARLDIGPLHPRAEMHGPEVGRLGGRRLPQLGALPFAVDPAPTPVRARVLPVVAVVAAGGIAATGVIAWSATTGTDVPTTASGQGRTEQAAPMAAAPPTAADAGPSAPPAGAPTVPAPTPEPPRAAAPSGTRLDAQAWFAGGRLVLVGAVPDQRIADALSRKAATIVGADQVVDGFTIDPSSPIPAGVPVVVAEQIRFAVGDAGVTAEFLPLVEAWKAILDANPGVRMRVTGFTDSTGPATTNLELSVARAQAVAGWMQERGLPATRFAVTGAGEDAPLTTNDTAEGRAVNRRIQVTLDGLLMA